MIVSPGRGYVFVHIPKTGGTALSLALEARAMKDDILVGDTPKAAARRRRLKRAPETTGLRKHSPLADLGDLIPPGRMAGYFVVTLVRNPWDRMVSYYHWLRAQSFAHPAVALARRVDFAGFLRHPETRASFAAWPYGAYVRGPGGAERCDLFIRLEHLAEDIAPFEAHLGFALTPLPRANVSERARDWRGYYDAETAALVGALCAEDAARFGYSFDS